MHQNLNIMESSLAEELGSQIDDDLDEYFILFQVRVGQQGPVRDCEPRICVPKLVRIEVTEWHSLWNEEKKK